MREGKGPFLDNIWQYIVPLSVKAKHLIEAAYDSSGDEGGMEWVPGQL